MFFVGLVCHIFVLVTHFWLIQIYTMNFKIDRIIIPLKFCNSFWVQSFVIWIYLHSMTWITHIQPVQVFGVNVLALKADKNLSLRNS